MSDDHSLGFTSAQWATWALARGATAQPSHLGPPISGVYGQLTLSESQQQAANQLLWMLDTHGGALLADAVGTGKTRVALATALAWRTLAKTQAHPMAHQPLVCCVPARLKVRWLEACRQVGLSVGQDVLIVTHTAMSRAHEPPTQGMGLMIVDEAHNMRNPGAARSKTLARWAIERPVLLVTATPVCNDLWDMYHLLRVFLSDDALRATHGFDLREAFAAADERGDDITPILSACVVRATDRHVGGARPDVALEYLTYQTHAGERWLWRQLEPTLRSMQWHILQDQWPLALLIEYVLQAWESGPRALGDALEMLIDYHIRWLEGTQQGVRLSREAHKRYFDQRNRTQNVLPFVWNVLPCDLTSSEWIASAQHDLDLLLQIADHLQPMSQLGDGRLRAMLDWMLREPRQKVLIFTRFEATAAQTYEQLKRTLGPSAQVGLLTGQRAEATGLGSTSQEDILQRFAPISQGLDPLPRHQRLRVLVATDCLAEGVNLQDCGCVVMLDLPYSPLGVEQRVGRLVRPGGPHLRVRVVVPRPADWSDSLGMRRRLISKAEHAQRVGVGLPLTQALFESDNTRALAQHPLDAYDQMCTLYRIAAARPLEDANALSGWWVSQGAAHHPDSMSRSAVHHMKTLCFVACAVLSVTTSDTTHQQVIWLSKRPQSDALELRPGAIAPVLIHALDARSPIREAPWPVSIIQDMTQHLDSLVHQRTAMGLAPPGVARHCVSDRIWTRVLALIQREPASWMRWSTALKSIKPRLLRGHVSGVDMLLSQWVEDHPDWSLEDILPMLDRILPEVEGLSNEAGPGVLSWSWVGGLWIRA